MIFKWMKYTAIGAGGALLVGGLLFGSDLFSCVRSLGKVRADGGQGRCALGV